MQLLNSCALWQSPNVVVGWLRFLLCNWVVLGSYPTCSLGVMTFCYFVQSLQAVTGELVTTLCDVISDSSRADNLTTQCWVTLAVGKDCEVIKTILNTDWVLCHEIVYICLTQHVGSTRLCIWNPCWNVPMLPNALLVQRITLILEVERTIGHGWAPPGPDGDNKSLPVRLLYLFSVTWSCNWSLSLRFCHWRAFMSTCVCYMTCPSHLSLLITLLMYGKEYRLELLIMQCSLLSCFFSVLNHMEELPMSTFCFCEFLVWWMS